MAAIGFVAPAARASPAHPLSSVNHRVAPAESVDSIPGTYNSVWNAATCGLGLVGVAVAASKQSAARSRNQGKTQIFAFEGELGVQAPVGYFDPLGFSKDGDAATFRRRRTVELKHGRVAMYAAMGYIVPEYFRFPGYLSPSENLTFDDVPNGLAALEKVPANGWLQITLFAGLFEFPTYNSTKAPGDLGWKVITSSDPDTLKRKLNSELANGRLAMFAIMGMLFQNGVTGTTGPEMWFPSGAFENEIGVLPPMGFWDPAQFLVGADEEGFKQMRQAELKHGRVCMLATMGYITPEYVRLPGLLSTTKSIPFANMPNGLAAIKATPVEGVLQWFLFCGLMELAFLEQDPARGAGDFKNAGVLGVPNGGGTMSDLELRKKKLNSELSNGRLAMMAFVGMLFQDGLTGSAWGDWALYTASPLRAFESELGVQAPVGYWDPLGLAADGDAEAFTRRRTTEIKHGRISMLATMGYITPEITGKLPGYLSPSAGLKFADVPNGLGAISKVPAAGWAQIVAYAFFCEYSSNYGEGMPSPGDYGFKPPLLATDDAELKTKRLNAEIANGRLSMMAIIGMFFQDGLTGSAWGDWALYTASPLRAFENETGVQAPTGFFDPAGFCKDGSVEAFNKRRSAELKHGRIAMLGAMGYITPELVGKFPGYLSPSMDLKYADIPNGVAALGKVPALGWAQMIGYAFFCEIASLREDFSKDKPGDYGFKVITSDDPETLKKKLNSELANGRLAMTAVTAMIVQNGVTGDTGPGMWLGGGAFENELGVQPPTGFFDPLGLTADGDAAAFRRRRISELKHGRIAMLACMGYIAPEFFRFPGFCSPSEKLAFTEIPNGLEALSVLPSAGIFQFLLWGGAIERGLFVQEDDRAPGDFVNGGVLGLPGANSMPDGEDRKRKLNSELANGRLAMMAIIGMFYQDGLTGSAWGDWALFTDSPLRAEEESAAFDPAAQVGVTEPLGFWDPAGFCSDGKKETFLALRGAELKHGRVAMLANLGFIFQHYVRFGQYKNVPDGVAALNEGAGGGFAVLFLIAGFYELKFLAEREGEPGNFDDPAGLVASGFASYDEETRSKELNNGRLAMIGAIGAMVANATTGLDAVEQWGEAKPAAVDFIKKTIPFAP